MSTSRRELTRWLLGTTRPVLAPLAASSLARLADQLLGLALFAVAAGAIARAATGQGPGWLPGSAVGLVCWLLAIALAKAAMRYAEQFLGHLVAFRALELLRADFFARLWPQSRLADVRSGDLLNRATKDIDRIESFFAHTFAPWLAALVVPTIAVLGIGWTTSWRLALVAGLGLAATWLLPLVGARRGQLAAQQLAGLRGELAHHLTDSVQGMVEVTGYGRDAERLAEMAVLDERIVRVQRSGMVLVALRRGLARAALVATPVLMALVAVPERLPLAQLAVSVAVVLRCFAVTRPVEDLVAELDNAFAAARRVHETTHADGGLPDAAVPQALPAGPLGLSGQGVTYAHPGQGGRREPALREVDVELPAGRHSCLVGASGSGKSTLLRLLLRADDPQAGSIRLGGTDLRDLAGDELHRAVALVTQQAQLFRGSIADNLRLAAPEASDEELWGVLRVAQIDAEVAAMSEGLATEVGEGGQQVSGGQRQRLALARALLMRPRVLVLDEYTANLDPELAARVRAAVREAMAGGTVVEVTHHVASSLEADHVVVLDQARVVQQGPPADLAGHGRYAALLERDRDVVG